MDRDITPEKFDEVLFEIIDELKPSLLVVAVPGVYEVLSEYFNNDVLKRIREELQDEAEHAHEESDQ